MLKTRAYAAPSVKAKIAPFEIQRREPKPHDVLIEILYCGICHSDIHQARDEWGGAIFPMVPGHEIVGKVKQVGSAVAKWKVGDTVGVGCFVDSCRECTPCKQGDEQFCEKGGSLTYNSTEQDKKTPTYGGYSEQITVDENYVLRIPEGMPLDRTAPLLCAGITTYSPLRHYHIQPGQKVAVLGLGGLGHMGVKLAKAMGAEVTVLSHSPQKAAEAKKLGADHFFATQDKNVFKTHANQFDFILNTISAEHDYNDYLGLLKLDGAMVVVGVPEKALPVSAMTLISKRRKIAGSLIGGISETQEMLDFCAKHNVLADIELTPIQKVNEAYERVIKGDVHYRFVIDMQSLKN